MVKKRVAWKLPYIHSVFFKNKFSHSHVPFLLRLRHSTVPATFISRRMQVYNGIWFLTTSITPNMVGFKTGAFSFTRRCDPITHSKEKRKRKKKNKKEAAKKTFIETNG